MKFRSVRSLTLLAGLLLPAVAMAHPGHAVDGAFSQGLLHPFTGIDHLLAMLGSGMWAAQLGGRARWQVPLAFVVMMMIGALVGMHTGVVALVETGIVASVIVLGVLVAAAIRAPHLTGAVVVAVFALLHGHAHGSEMGSVDGAGLYIAGFALATLLLHGIAVAAATLLQVRRRAMLVRTVGALIAAVGAMLLAL